MSGTAKKSAGALSPPDYSSGGETTEHPDYLSGDQELPALARRSVEAYVRERCLLSPSPPSPDSILNQRAACFVSIKTTDGDLRGCIGTIEPSYHTLAEEIIFNAVSAATRDPRFFPVTEPELSHLRFSVDVLSTPEPAQVEQLDPAVYGVIVEDDEGVRRGLLLPDIEGVKTPTQQVQIAAQKAGITPDTPIRLYRFRVTRFTETGSQHSTEQGA